MTKKEKVNIILNFLEKKYKYAKCFLEYEKPHELLIAARLSAQCTDRMVNIVIKKLFLKHPSLESFLTASFKEIKEIINPCGLSNKKTEDILNITKMLYENFNSKVPNNQKELLTLPGIGRKTANLILSELFNVPTIVVDTHVIRITNRLNLVNEKNPKKIEEKLLEIIPKKERKNFCHRIISFGREICSAKKPLCNVCELKILCKNHKN